MAKRTKRVELDYRLVLAMNHISDTVIGIERVADSKTVKPGELIEQGKEVVPFLRITAHGLEQDSMRREAFLREFNRDLLYEEWSALIKFREIAMRKDGNSAEALALLERMFNMKIKELDGKEMSELVSMHNELAKSLGKKEVAKFKSVEVAKIAIVQLSNVKPAAKSKASKATGKGQEGRPRTGVGKFAKELLAKGKSNTEVLEAVKKEFPKNSTTLSCVAYYRAHMVKDGLLPKTAKKEKAKAKPAKGQKAKKTATSKPAETQQEQATA